MQGLLALPTGWENAWLQASQGWMGQRRLHSGPTRARSALHRHAESAELFDGSLRTNHLSQRLTNIWCRDERSVSADRRCHCVSQSIEHCVTEGGNTRAESCPRAHHHCREMSLYRVCLPLLVYFSMWKLCLYLIYPGLASESGWLGTHLLFKTKCPGIWGAHINFRNCLSE